MSFTTVAALARDNGYQMVIVIAGTSLNSAKPINEPTRRRPQSAYKVGPALATFSKVLNLMRAIALGLKNVIDDWKDPTVPKQDRQTILITIMKHHQHLKALADHPLQDRNFRGIYTNYRR